MTGCFEWREAPRGDYAVVGDPIGHSLSPRMHAAAYRAVGLHLTYFAIRVPADEFAPAMDRLASLGYEGLNVTVPLKERAAAWVRMSDAAAARAGVVNTIRFRDASGINTDGPGFLQTLRMPPPPHGPIEPPSRILVLGAGGSARAIVAALCDAGYPTLVFNRTRARADDMVRSLNVEARVLDSPSLAGVDLVVNATSASLSGRALDLPWQEAHRRTVAYDLGYGALSPFLSAAAAQGLATVDGRPLLVEQGALAFEYWLARAAPREAMRQAIEA